MTLPVLPEYVCHKRVRAAKILAIHWGWGQVVVDLGSDKTATIDLPQVFWMKHDPVIGGYIVVYEDGYVSFSPQKAFEEGYTLA